MTTKPYLLNAKLTQMLILNLISNHDSLSNWQPSEWWTFGMVSRRL